jgi:XTP/dITP diphosphohydrolase
MDLLIGTHNPGKLREYRALLAEAPVRVVGLDEIGLREFEVEETGETFGENAARKALAYARASGLFALADDTGLLVDALGGRPGLHSARYGPPELDDRGRRQLLLSELESVPDEARTARFVCVIAVANPQTMTIVTANGACEGRIAHEEQDGEEGFGYDAVFIPNGYTIPWSRVTRDEKNRISHRGEAARLIPCQAWRGQKMLLVLALAKSEARFSANRQSLTANAIVPEYS